MPTETTEGIRITVRTRYMPERSNPAGALYVFAYEITIANDGAEPAQLVSRHWVITDSDGRVEEVRGPGVVGETPHLDPGESFTYTSFCPLKTEHGTMSGTYRMVRDGGEEFDAVVPTFELGEAWTVH
jgi:ApaG protein